MKIYAIVPLILCTTMAVAVSLLLIPSHSEMALIRFKNKEYEEALSRYEDMWRSGARSVGVGPAFRKRYGWLG